MIWMTEGYQAKAAVFSQPLTHARILWDNVLAGAVFSATSEREGFEAARAQSADTVSWWWPAVAGTLTATFAAVDIDGIGIAAHTLGSAGVTVTAEARIGGVWTALHDPISPKDDAPIMIAFEKVTADAVRIFLSSPARVGVLCAGAMLEMPRPGYTQLPPLALMRATTYETNKSQTGQFMGRSIVSTSRPFQATWDHLPEDWMRNSFDRFARAAREVPFFVALRPARFPSDVGYVLTSQDVIPERMGMVDLMSVTIVGEAHAEPGA
ncbi:hypothetical protein [Pseudogemmobacter humi]|uniref:Uncharacterized protein n=1 Tax=Pseudogemmobacter humi TaxID=2483812 RepID=A0A3P5XA97_9RHOB|nr:hypothetical protein [Pseudogemmobacter humi]VDC31428.1 hypothetical protein XINFAN_02887 [Pseudogemmobacter humi]